MPRKKQSFPFSINAKNLSLPSLGFIFGVAVGGHLFDPPPPPIYQTAEKIQTQACFTPRHQCLPLILKEIVQAKKEILVQAYQLTSKPLAFALEQARTRGVSVRILADKSQESSPQSQVYFLHEAGIEVRIDAKPHIAHNKIILIDRKILIGGSYNYSEGAEKFNAENVLILKNSHLVQEYLKNWKERYTLSRSLKPRITKKNESSFILGT